MHTVEKIGGTSMTQFGAVMRNIIVGDRRGPELYNRIFVVSAYGGITDLLLEHKKSGKPGVYALYAALDPSWEAALSGVATQMCELNATFGDLGLDVDAADSFVRQRLAEIRSCLLDLRRLRSYGHFQLTDQLGAVRELLSAVGEAHSAWNAVEILNANGISATYVDLTGWKDTDTLPMDEKIASALAELDFSTTIPVVTGYTKCSEGIMSTFDRGYSEITFARVAVLTNAAEGVIHKEFHLSTGDPKLVGADRVRVIGRTNYDVADQLADIGMEAIHPKASKGMERAGIPIRVKNTFEPNHPGTVIDHTFKSDSVRVDMVTGHKQMVGVEVWDSSMVGQAGYDYRLLAHFARHGISYVAKNTNANTITHFFRAGERNLDQCVADIREAYPHAKVRVTEVSIVCAIGSNMDVPGFLARAASALANEGINILAFSQCLRQVNMQFIVSAEEFETSIIALHRALVEREPDYAA
ncbi:MAG: aspartate kinase [Myxococcales bacterium]|nr:aspartate kinase [Myxococcales bacterium]